MSSIFNKRLEYLENSFQRYSQRRKKSIYNSLIRPLYQEILQSLYLIFIMILDAFILIEIIIYFNIPINLLLFLIISFIIIYFEYKLYKKIWGLNGIWSINKYIKKK